MLIDSVSAFILEWFQRANSIAQSSYLTVSLKRLRFGDAGVDREEFLCRDQCGAGDVVQKTVGWANLHSIQC